MKLLAVLALLALAGCAGGEPRPGSHEWYQNPANWTKSTVPYQPPQAYEPPDSALQDYANFMGVVQGMRGPQMNPADVLFMQPRQYPPLPYRTCRPPYC